VQKRVSGAILRSGGTIRHPVARHAHRFIELFHRPMPSVCSRRPISSLPPSDNLSVEIGKLPTLIGDEDTFSFQNPQMERGLLWDQTNAQTRAFR